MSETRPNAYRVIWSSEWCELNTGCSMNGVVRARAGGSAVAAAPAVSSSAVKAGGLPPLKTAHTASMSSTAVVSSHDSVRSSPSRRKLRPALWPAARASAALMPAGGVTRIVSKNLSDFEVQPSFSRPASRRVADCMQWPAICLRPSGPWYIAYSAETFARSAWAVQMFEVALSRRMCCSRVCIAMRYAGLPVQ